jgi:hypothetical protein
MQVRPLGQCGDTLANELERICLQGACAETERALPAGKYRDELPKEHTGRVQNRLWQDTTRAPAR